MTLDNKDLEKYEVDFFNELEAFSKRFRSNEKCAEYLGLTTGVLNSYLYRNRKPKFERIRKLTELMRSFNPSQYISKAMPFSIPEPVIGESLPTIPVFLSAGAGLPVELWESEAKKSVQILPKFYHKDIIAVEVVGDSMEPTIKKGAIVGVVPITGDLAEGNIYLVRRPPFGLQVKRVRTDENGNIVLESDNPAYKPQVVPFEGYENIIVGRIVWYLQDA